MQMQMQMPMQMQMQIPMHIQMEMQMQMQIDMQYNTTQHNTDTIRYNTIQCNTIHAHAYGQADKGTDDGHLSMHPGIQDTNICSIDECIIFVCVFTGNSTMCVCVCVCLFVSNNLDSVVEANIQMTHSFLRKCEQFQTSHHGTENFLQSEGLTATIEQDNVTCRTKQHVDEKHHDKQRNPIGTIVLQISSLLCTILTCRRLYLQSVLQYGGQVQTFYVRTHRLSAIHMLLRFTIYLPNLWSGWFA